MSLWTQDLLGRAKIITEQGKVVRLFFGEHHIDVRSATQSIHGIIEGETAACYRYAISEESLLGIAELG